MSFSSDVKQTLCEISYECDNCIKAELAGIISFSGQLNFDMLKLSTEKQYIAQRITECIYKCTNEKISYIKGRNIKIEISNPTVLDKIKACTAITSDEFEDIFNSECCMRSFIRGAFIGGGCVLNPEKSYHLEFDTRYKISAIRLCNIIEKCGIEPKLTYRKGHYLVYFKGSDDIADILGLIGAGMGALKMYTTQMEKDMRNSINRQVNCEMANQKKTSKAASRQLFAIKKLKDSSMLSKLPEVLQEIASLREKYPDISLKELGEMMDPPLGKSGVNHRLNRIMEYADSI